MKFEISGNVEPKSEEFKGEETWKTVAKYFAHGIVFSTLYTILYIAWAFGLLILVQLGSFIGLIIGFVLLILIIGFVNCFVTSWLWFPVDSGFWQILLHGFLLFITLIIANLVFVFAPSILFPGITTSIITFIVSSFINGFIAKTVAGLWETELETPESVKIEYSEKKL
ncbi:MAG: hypothetical protein ACPLW8_02485 [Candidatus Bathyarchaeales archaeon]